MFCFKCGNQIRDDATFCQYCGTQQKNTVNGIVVGYPSAVRTSSTSGELDRNALKIYLGDILFLECIKAKYERRISDLNYTANNIARNNYVKRYLLREGRDGSKYIHLRYCDGLYHLAWFKSGEGIGPFTWNDLNKEYFEWTHWKDDADIEFLKKNSCWDGATGYSAGFFAKMEQREEAKNAFFRNYAEFKAEAPIVYLNNLKKISALRKEERGIKKELDRVKQLLKQAYDANLIPSPFRHKIHAIYYLHNFVSTSQESFSSALLHLDLDEIKAKLDKIIAHQESIIIQNAVMIAQNEKLAKQNQEQLERLSIIESNTSQAAQYAQIAANNAEICAWISMANYIEAHR